jgi:hypothetical protein
MEKKRKEERIRTLNINRLSAMGAAIPVSRSECHNEIIVLQGATACAEPAIGIIIGRWIRSILSQVQGRELGEHTAAVEGLASTGRRPPAATDAEGLADLKI